MLNNYSKICVTGGRVWAKCSKHPKANTGGYVLEHVLVIENLRGEHLRSEEVVHHVDGNSLNNSPSNLMTFENDYFHKWHHKELRALEACGNENWRKCYYCQKYDDPANMHDAVSRYFHRECKNKYSREYRAKKKLEGKDLKWLPLTT